MNCEYFRSVIIEVTREQSTETASRDEALAHCKECEQCRLALETQTAISDWLRELALDDAASEAPSRIESELVRVYRLGHNVRAGRSSRVGSLARAAWVCAAVALLAVTLSVYWVKSPALQTDPATSATPERSNRPNGAPLKVERPTQPSVRVSTGQNFSTRQERSRRFGRQESRPESAEIMTAFLPLTYTSDVVPLENLQVVRVKLPRSALTAFGLPMNMERAGEPIQADVLIGNDGLAHAIRFVQ